MEEIETLELYQKFLLNQKNYSSHTVESYTNDIKLFMIYCDKEDVSLFSCDKIVIRNFLEHERKRGISKTTLKRRVVALRRYFDFLLNKDIVRANPFINIVTPKTDKKLPAFLYNREIKKLFELNKKRKDKLMLRDEAIIELLYVSGIRVAELCSIKMLDMQMKQRAIRINGKGKKQRIVLFTEETQKTIEKYIKEVRSQLILSKKSNHRNYVFLNSNGNPLTPRGVEYILENIEKKTGLGLSLHPHIFRHSFATTMLNKGADLRTIQKILGHENLATTQIYTHIITDKIKDDYDKFFPRSKKKE